MAAAGKKFSQRHQHFVKKAIFEEISQTFSKISQISQTDFENKPHFGGLKPPNFTRQPR